MAFLAAIADVEIDDVSGNPRLERLTMKTCYP
ncbi:hypothetical protein B0G76_5058 [Paraburkholderia sp. BL23I1N1]|nr:hypothetical protein B0G76_5058 [Paraburkholderia sp. BL23I1N1]